MDILIVDDEPLARQRLIRMIGRIDGYEVVAEAGRADEVMVAICQHDPDVVLLDVRMPGEDGLSLAYRIAELEDPPALIFCTAFDQYALEAFGTQAVGYLLKPVKAEHLQEVLAKACRLNKLQRVQLDQAPSSVGEPRKSHIRVKTRRGLELLAVDDIRCFVADQKYVTAYHPAGEHLLDESLRQLEDDFGDRFVRVHRNTLVAHAHMEAMEKNAQGQYSLRLAGVNQTPLISRRHASLVKKAFESR